MNIFAVDEDPALAAFSLPDKHIVKMPLETTQMIALVFSKWYCCLLYTSDAADE